VQYVTSELSSIVTFRVKTAFRAIQFSFHTQNAFSAYASHKVGIRESGGMAPGTLNTLRTGDADLRFYVTTVQGG